VSSVIAPTEVLLLIRHVQSEHVLLDVKGVAELPRGFHRYGHTGVDSHTRRTGFPPGGFGDLSPHLWVFQVVGFIDGGLVMERTWDGLCG
jgi:hypothetical protein